MAESRPGIGDCDDLTADKARPSSTVDELGEPRVTPDSCLTATDKKPRELGVRLARQVPTLETVVRHCPSTERDDVYSVDEELRRLGLWEEGMTEDEKMKLLQVVADSKKMAQREEAVRKNQFDRSTASTDVVRDAWLTKPPGVFVDPCLAAPDPLLCSDPTNDTSQSYVARANEDDEWPALCDIPYERRLAAAKSSKRTRLTRRVYSMDKPLNFKWEDEDSLDDLYDIRFPQKKDPAQFPVAKQTDFSEIKDVPPVKSLPSRSPSTMLSQAVKRAELQEKRLPGPTELLNSWEELHKALRAAQSAPGLPVRPWGHPINPSPVDSQDSRAQDMNNPPRQDMAEGDAHRPSNATVDTEAQC